MCHRELFMALFFILVACFGFAQAQDLAPHYPNTQELTIPFTPPHKALEMMEVPDGFEVSLFAHEPDVHQPIAMTFDAKGRLWVVENYTYSDRKEDFNNDDLHDRVLIFEDQDNDGKFDQRKVFWDQGNKLTGIEIGRGGVWLTAAPELIFIPDRDRDDVPDGPPQVILDGFDDKVIRHNMVNGLRWGPDGWLYSRHGILAVSYVGKPGATISQRLPMNCCVWRYHPEREIVEIVAEGGTNFWGFDFDEHGEMFVINTVIGHLFHVVPGARYDRMYGTHSNPYTWQTIEQTADHVHWATNEKWSDARGGIKLAGRVSDATDRAGGGHAHSGFMIYQGDNWPAAFRGRALTLNFHGRRMNQERLVRDGNSFIGKHGPDIFRTSDPWFRGVELSYGPDGAVYVLDWSDIGECHERDGIHRTSGRIFKISYGQPAKPTFADLNQLDEAELRDLFSHENAWYRRMARRILADRESLAEDKQVEQQAATNSHARLSALWSSYPSASTEQLLRHLESADEHVRKWAVRLLADQKIESPQAAARLVELADDQSPLVRLYLASALNRLDSKSAFALATKLVGYESDMQDRVQPKLIWHRIEPLIADDYERSMDLFAASKSQQLRRNIARRLACDPKQQSEMLERLVGYLLNESAGQADVLHGIKLALQGRRQVSAPESWPSLLKQVAQLDAESAKLVAEIRPIFGDGLSLDHLRSIAADKRADTDARRQAIASLAQFAEPASLLPLFKSLLRDHNFRETVVKAISVCQEPEVASLVLKEFPKLNATGKQQAIDTLCSRKPWTQQLLVAIEKGRIAASELTAWHARQIQLYGDERLTQQLEQVWGQVRGSNEQRIAQIDQLRQSMPPQTLASADLSAGKKLFTDNCATCHVLFGEGGNVGPDLTGADRKNLNYLLENIIDPSASVATTYRSSIVALEDGRQLTGVVLDNDGQTLKLQTKTERLVLELSAIEDIKTTELSLMPDNLIDKLSEEEKVDLFGFLMSQ